MQGGRKRMSEDLEEVFEKPESMLSAKTKQALLETIKSETEKALKQGDYAYAADLQNARKLIEKGAWKLRRANPYLAFVAECVPTTKPHQGKLTLEETQKLMRECAEKWRQLPENEKAKYRVLAGQLGIYDFL
jgi:ElaB/YqjD/DUF883 family membrane-anchored ribosome-binding protein